MTEFIKLNSFQEENGIYIRSSAITVIHMNNEGMTKVFIQGIPQPLDIIQTPDEVLAVMGDDAASLPARHVAEHKREGTNDKKLPKDHLDHVKNGYQKAG